MNKQEFAKGIKMLELTYNTKFDEEKLNFWYRQLSDVKTEVYYNNLKRIIKTSEYLPNIAQIRGEEKKTYANYEQRDYSEFDFDSLYT